MSNQCLIGLRILITGLFLEMFLTALLMITILLLAAEKHKATYLAPVGIGLALFIAEMTGVYYTGGSLNPVSRSVLVDARSQAVDKCRGLCLRPGHLALRSFPKSGPLTIGSTGSAPAWVRRSRPLSISC